MKTTAITAKTVFYFDALPIVRGLFLFFNGHKLLGILTAIALVVAAAS